MKIRELMFYARTFIFHCSFDAIPVHRDTCFGGNSAKPSYPPNTVIPRDGNFDSHIKPMKYTYNQI